MSVIPAKGVEPLPFFGLHNPQHNLVWAAHAVAIGLTAAQAPAFNLDCQRPRMSERVPNLI